MSTGFFVVSIAAAHRLLNRKRDSTWFVFLVYGCLIPWSILAVVVSLALWWPL
jgi:hypothetical protein